MKSKIKNSMTPKIGMSFLALVLPMAALAQDVNPDKVLKRPKIYSPYVERTASDANLAEGVYWGDTHLHTSYSTDAGMMGNTLGPEEAYRFARGEEVRSAAGMRTRLIRPLDFLVVSDHAENLGLAPMIAESNSELLKNEWVYAVGAENRKWTIEETVIPSEAERRPGIQACG